MAFRARYVRVVVDTDAPGLPQPFTYLVPDHLNVEIGDAVLVPFGPSRELIGYVVGLDDKCDPAFVDKLKPLAGVIDGARLFDSDLWAVAQWVTNQTLAELRDSIRLIAPPIASARIQTSVSIPDAATAREPHNEAEVEILERVSAGKPVSWAQLTSPSESSAKAARALVRCGALEVHRSVAAAAVRQKRIRVLGLLATPDEARVQAEALRRRAPKQAQLLDALIENVSRPGVAPMLGLAVDTGSSAAARALAAHGLARYHEVAVRRDPYGLRIGALTTPPPLSAEQDAACSVIASAIVRRSETPILIYGVTGSGKTEVYLDAIARTLELGRSALVLLPEIGLSAQVLDVMKARFGDQVAVLHSALSGGERFDEWQRIRAGEARVVVGARSAVFAPMVDLGLIVVDEEHESSYKQDVSPRYHARDVAAFRAKQNHAVLVLGSATPSLESYHRARIGRYELVELTKRVADRPLPTVRLIDLREDRRARAEERSGDGEAASQPPVGAGVLSKELIDALGQRLVRDEQVILFINRRGFSPFLLCRDCGFSPRCPMCDVTLTYHRGMSLLRCHHCGYAQAVDDACPKCHGVRLLPFGVGTEKVEEAVRELFPEARTLRMDRDTTVRKGTHAQILRSFRNGEADILIGTQMVAKGLDFPRVTLVGVVNADTALNLPDYHAGERAFQLLTQVAGRSGRGETPGEVLVQTFNPEDRTLELAAQQDYVSFYSEEIVQREAVRYPPFAHLANLVFSDEIEGETSRRALAMAECVKIASDEMKMGKRVEVLGPVACALSRLRGKYRWHLVVRTINAKLLRTVVKAAIEKVPAGDRAGLSLDIDPITML